MALHEAMFGLISPTESEKAREAVKGIVTDEELGLDKRDATTEEAWAIARKLLSKGGWGKSQSSKNKD